MQILMKKRPIPSASDDIILNLKILAAEKESVRRKLAVTAAKLAATAKKLAITAREKESVRRKLAIVALEKEGVRRKLAVTAAKLAATADKLAATAKEKEDVRRKLVVTAAKLAATAEELAATAREKEIVRRKLAVTAAKLAATAEKLAITAKKLAATAAKLAVTAEEKESVRRKLVVTAEEKEMVRRKLVVTAAQLAVVAEEKESVRRKLVVTAAKLAVTAEERENVRRKLAISADEKEDVRRKLVVTAEKLEMSHKTLEQKVLERTKSLEVVRAKEGAILLSIGDGLIATDQNGKIILINETAERLLGKTKEEVIGKTYSEITLLEDELGTPVILEKHPVNMALKKGTKTAGTTYYNLRKDNSKFPVAITVTPVILAGKVVGTIKVFRDITYEREIDKAKTEFVSLASHQLRTPLSTVNWYAEMLLEGDVGELNCKQKKYLEEVYRSNKRMVELVNALLDVSSLELGTFVIDPMSTDICKLARNVIHEQKPQIDARKIQFRFSCYKKSSFMQADPKLLRMVMQNILSNAVKYTPIGGKVELSIRLADRKNILIKITDNGYGIPKKQHGKIFTKLFRADNVREKDTDGTGLGLYIVKSVVEKSGGKIWFESTHDKRGTTFYVTLPIKGVTKKQP